VGESGDARSGGRGGGRGKSRSRRSTGSDAGPVGGSRPHGPAEGLEGVWALVPARGGSRGVPGKNLRLLGTKPLILHALGMLRGILPEERVVVSTEDSEIERVCVDTALIHARAAELAADHTTLDMVALDVARWLLAEHGASPDDVLLTVQPTSPFLEAGSVRACVERLREGARSVLTVRDDRHLRWMVDENGAPRPLYAERVNRQQLPPTFVETGGIIGTRIGALIDEGTRVSSPIALVELPPEESLDIDTHQDWAVAEFLLGRRRIVIRADGARTLGMGHVHRALALAYELSHHHVTLVTRCDGEFALGAEALTRSPFTVRTLASHEAFASLLEELRPDMTVLDVLDTDDEFTGSVGERSGFVVSIEDLGPGNRLADLVINDLYTDVHPQENHWYGVQHALLARQFDQLVPAPVDVGTGDGPRLLVTFGGTDQQNLTVRTLEALAAVGYQGHVDVVLGRGYDHGPVDLSCYGLRGTVERDVRDMVAVMRSAGLAVTSAGRTVTELMVVGVPTLVLCQNLRELRHTHASGPFGVINLGLGEHVAVSTLAEHIGLLLGDEALRRDMRMRASAAVRGRSNAEICRRILERAEAKWSKRR